MRSSLLIVVLFCATALVRAVAGDELDAETQARLKKFDSGPVTIDVTRYPKPIQASYQVFTNCCGQCHTLSRPINANYALPGEWERYLKRMFAKPGFPVSDTVQIFEFLVYDSSIRKQAMVQAKLAQATAEDRKTEEQRIKAVRAKHAK